MCYMCKTTMALVMILGEHFHIFIFLKINISSAGFNYSVSTPENDECLQHSSKNCN